MQKLLEDIKKIFHIEPISLIDIGARYGKQRPWQQLSDEYLSYYGIEADAKEYKKLHEANKSEKFVTYFLAALSDKETTETLYLTQDEGSSSIYKPNYKYTNKFYNSDMWRIKDQISLQTTTLKKIFDENKIKADFLKIDTEGAELKILKGADRYLDNILGMEIEVEFLPLYEEQPLFYEVNAFVRERGFELYDLNRYWANQTNINQYSANRGQLILADAIFFRSIDSFYSSNYSSDEEKRAKLIKMIVMLVLYGFFDVAIEYIHYPITPFNRNEIELLEKAINDMCRYPNWQKLLLNNNFADLFGRLLHYFGNLFSFKSKTCGWGTDYNTIDGRYLYHATGKLRRYFKK